MPRPLSSLFKLRLLISKPPRLRTPLPRSPPLWLDGELEASISSLAARGCGSRRQIRQWEDADDEGTQKGGEEAGDRDSLALEDAVAGEGRKGGQRSGEEATVR
ncbi:hypothetical protein E2562_016026 [Oryza meyeriana var. granulata]|uniref:Uncharacterized protein n=1 Tax=Oryza meyeriana var. granulata TaxID=110450 RepID=A0A6G1ELM0_9ORYZ|nr:hypothetical protein E2562_016026 [Oryza meyeriana var. granulata]